MVRELSVLAMLGICSLEDIKSRKIPVWLMAGFAAEGIIGWMLFWKQPVWEFAASILPGSILLAAAAVFRGSIGSGDGIALAVTGIFLGAMYTTKMLLYAAFFSASYALYLYLVKKKGKDYEIPFIPFLLMAFILEMAFGSLKGA